MAIDLLLRGGATAILALLAVLSWRSGERHRLFAATYVCGGLFLLISSPSIRAELGPLQLPATAMAATGPFWFLIATRRVFGAAARLRSIALFAPAAAMAGMAAAASTAQGELASALWMLVNLSLLGCFLAALFTAWSGLADDLDPRRRSHRRQVLAAGAGLGVVVAAGSIGLGFNAPDGARALLQLAAVAGTFAIAFWSATRTLRLAEPARPRSANGVVRSALATKVLAALNDDRLYRDSELTVSRLSQAVGAPEAQVRQAINAELGAKNFSEFVNGYRLADATSALADASQAEVSIATIALDAGFGSIASFNRVFKVAYGMTPSDYRRQQPAQPAQNEDLSTRA